MKPSRRSFLRSGLAAGSITLVAAAGLLIPRSVLAVWPKSAFNESKLAKAIDTLFDGSTPLNSSKIHLKVPEIAENGAVVTVAVKSTLTDIEAMSVFVAENKSPLCASYLLYKQSAGTLSGRVKMSKTSDIVVVIKADGKLYMTKKPVKVTRGGCG